MDKFKIDKTKIDSLTAKKIFVSTALVFAIVLQFAFLSYLLKSLMPDSEKNNKNVVMKYTSRGNLNYRVYLKPNEFINAPSLGPGEAYVLDLIDYIQLSSMYNFSSTSKTEVNGTNKLVAKLKVYYKESTDRNNNPEILNKEKTLAQKEISFDENAYNTSNTYNLKLDEYLKLLKDFQSKIKVSVEGFVEVSSETNLNGKVGGASYNTSYNNVIKIPLSQSVMKIESENPEDVESKVYEGDLVKTNKTIMGFVIIANIVIFVIICLLLKQLFMFTNKTEYEKVLNKLLKAYDDIIVNTSTILDANNYKVIEIDEFKELLNLSRELLLPIMNYETVKDYETWLYVIKDDILYLYIINNDKLEAEKNEKKKGKKGNKTSNI